MPFGAAAGQEVVAVLDGSLRLILRADETGGEETVALSAGSACVVPRNRWHRLEVDSPATLQSITRAAAAGSSR